MRTLNFRLVVHNDGLLLLLLAAVMTIPMTVDAVQGNPDWQVFALSAGITAFVGGLLAITCYRRKAGMDRRTGYLQTVTAWLILGAFASLPLCFSSLRLDVTDAFFETMSGLTVTGSTVIKGLDTLPPGLLLWRSLLQWIGGIGIVVMAMVLFPELRVGGMQLFHTESSDVSGKPVPRVIEMAGLTVAVYLALSTACAIAYAAAGMSGFDAINHAMTTLATGGFSTHDASFGAFGSLSIEVVSIVFMTAGALPLFWYAEPFLRHSRSRSTERQVPALLAALLVAVLLATIWNVAANGMPVPTALRQSAFNVTSVLTDTGYTTADFSTWGGFALGLFFSLYLIGGCAGSTAGSIKIFRWQILFGGIVRQLKRMTEPNLVVPTEYGGLVVDHELLHAVRNFFFMYILTLVALSLLVMATGLDFLSSASAVATAMANAGPGLGPVVGPSGNFAGIPDAAKWLLMVAMLVGRLELSTVYVLLLVSYWRA